MILKVDGDEWEWLKGFVMCLRVVPTLEQVYANAKVLPASYAGGLIQSLYGPLVRRSTDLKMDYSTYFCQEYSTVEEYLWQRHNLDEADISAIVKEWHLSAAVLYSTPAHSFLQDEGGTELLAKLFEGRRAS